MLTTCSYCGGALGAHMNAYTQLSNVYNPPSKIELQHAVAEGTDRIIKVPMHPAEAPAKKITVSLTYYTNAYKVTSITNSAWYKPGDWLKPEVVADICKIPNWEVVVVDNDIMATILGIASKLVPAPVI